MKLTVDTPELEDAVPIHERESLAIGLDDRGGSFRQNRTADVGREGRIGNPVNGSLRLEPTLRQTCDKLFAA